MAAPSYGKRALPNGTSKPPEVVDFVRKKIKLSDLPITPAQRSVIDGLVHTFKKKGEFDTLRKSVYAEFAQGVRQFPSRLRPNS